MSCEQNPPESQSEQLRYARTLEFGMYTGLVVLFVTFTLYVSGVVAPVVPLDQIAHYWNQGVDEYLDAVNRNHLHLEHPPTGWTWVTMLGKGDFLNFVGISILGGITIFCYLAIAPLLWRKRDFIYLAMVALEVIVLALAASGLLGVGH